MRAIQVTTFGGAEVLELVDLPTPEAREPLLLLDVSAAGVHYADTRQAADDYLAPQKAPFVPGAEVVVTDPPALAPFGRLVAFGLASRVPPTPVQPGPLIATSRAVVGFWLSPAPSLPGGRYPLEGARQAHEDIASRRTHGKLVLDLTLSP
jgi:hypothetical protein